MSDAVKRCPICEKSINAAFVEGFDRYSIYQCPNCKLQFSDPLEYDERLYTGQLDVQGVNNYYSEYMLRSIEYNKEFNLLNLPGYARHALKWVISNIDKKSIIFDIGCGDGAFLSALLYHDYQAIGSEVDKRRLELFRQCNFNVVGSIDDYPASLPRPSVVTLFEVLEHVTDPLGFLRNISAKFPDSLIIVSVPSYKRWSLRTWRMDSWDYPPNHFTRWTDRTLNILLEKINYKCKISFPSVLPEDISGSVMLSLVKGSLHKNKKTLKMHTVPSIVAPIKFATPEEEHRRRMIKRYIYWPISTYYNLLGYSGSSMVAIASPNKKSKEN